MFYVALNNYLRCALIRSGCAKLLNMTCDPLQAERKQDEEIHVYSVVIAAPGTNQRLAVTVAPEDCSEHLWARSYIGKSALNVHQLQV